jgi:hypothetical protein
MHGHLDSHRIQIHAHQARIVETAAPGRARTVADPRWRRVVDALGRGARHARRVASAALTLPEPGPVRDAPPAMLGRHPRP